jgi:GNAT superfamily N-acetyltransferase
MDGAPGRCEQGATPGGGRMIDAGRPPLAARVRYYLARIGDRLERAGLPMRRRSLLFFGHEPVAPSPPPVRALDTVIELVAPARFRSLEWTANPAIRDEAADFQGRGKREVLAAVRGDRLLGFCWLEAETADLRFFDVEAALPRGTAYLSRVWVAPSDRGSGLGRSLIEAAAAIAADLGHLNLVSACVPGNGRMRHLFRELGWTPLGRVDYFRVGPAIFFERRRPGYRTLRARGLETGGRLVFER